jgi:GMP synthase-like glutamine amidotransferase
MKNNISLDIVHSYLERLPSDMNYDALIIGGTPDSVCHLNKYPYLKNVYQFLTKAVKNGKPCFGICCGAQLLAIVLGSNIYRNRVMEIGCYKVTITSDGVNDLLMKGFPKRFPVFQWHGDAFEVPGGARLLVTGKQCRNQLFRYYNNVGILFHLEISAEGVKKWAEKYSNELSEFGKTIDQVVEECRVHETKMKEFAYLLMSNYLNMVTNSI